SRGLVPRARAPKPLCRLGSWEAHPSGTRMNPELFRRADLPNGFLSATDRVTLAAHEPSRRGSCDLLEIGSRIARPCNEPIRTHEHRPEAEAILGVASHVSDSVAPRAVKRFQRRVLAEVQQQAVSISEQCAEPPSVLELEVRATAAHQRMFIAE